MINEEEERELEFEYEPEESQWVEPEKQGPNGLLQKIPRKYIKYITMSVFIIVAITMLAAFMSLNSEEKEEVVAESEVSEETKGQHPLVAASQLISVPKQQYFPNSILIANTPSELLQELPSEGWELSSTQKIQNGIQNTYQEIGQLTSVIVSLQVFSNDQIGRKIMLDNYKVLVEDGGTIVSDIKDIGSGGFITNNENSLSLWFYFEPNITSIIRMSASNGGSISNLKEWAYRTNQSIYRTLNQ